MNAAFQIKIYLQKNLSKEYAGMLSDGSYNHGFKGNLIAQEYTDEYGADELNEYLDSTSLIDVVDNTEKHTQ